MSGWQQLHTVSLSGILHTSHVGVQGRAVHCMVAVCVSLLGLWGRCALKGRCLIKTILLQFHRGHLKGQWYFRITSMCMKDSWPIQLTFTLTHDGVRAGLSRPIPHFYTINAFTEQGCAAVLYCCAELLGFSIIHFRRVWMAFGLLLKTVLALQKELEDALGTPQRILGLSLM